MVVRHGSARGVVVGVEVVVVGLVEVALVVVMFVLVALRQ